MKKIFAVIISAFICFSLLIPAYAVNEEEAEILNSSLLVDEADVLTDYEEQALLSKLNAYTEALKCELIIVTVDYTDGKETQDYADDFYDYNGYGYGDTTDGVLFLYSKNDYAWAVSTCGTGMILTTDTIDNIIYGIADYVRGGEYNTAFTKYADDMFNELADYTSEEYPDLSSAYEAFEESQSISVVKKEHNPIIWFAIVFAVAFVIAFLIMKGATSNLKSVKQQKNASSYIVSNSFVLTGQSDSFLYSNVVRTAIPKNTSSGGSNGSHTSSSGTTHGGSSGHF